MKLFHFQPSRSRWRLVFYVTSGIMAFGGIVFAIFAKGEELPWAKESKEDEQSDTDRIHHIVGVDWVFALVQTFHFYCVYV